MDIDNINFGGMSVMSIGLGAGIIILALLTIGLIFARLYKRASKEVSFVRTGFGGQKVIMNGGALQFPVLHEIIPVNMKTLRLAVNRANDQALITKDRMRVDVVAEFYVRVQPNSESIANAAQTLGLRTMRPDELKELMEGKFVDALRSVAAEMSMEELHEKRTDFVQKVQQVVSEDLLKNGLELETVSLTGLDQTSMEFFNPNNAFDAEGLTRLTEEIETRRKIRNDIEQDTEVQVQSKNLEAEKMKLNISRDKEYAHLEQQREIQVRQASQAAEIASEQAEKQRMADEAKIVAEQRVEQAKIEKVRLIKEKDIGMERSVEIANQERDIAIAEKSKEQSEASAEADKARALAVQAEEQVITSREKEIAERGKQIELIEAAKIAEREAIGIKIAAEAEKMAALNLAEAVRTEARAESDKTQIIAEGEAEAEKAKAAAADVSYQVEAAGTRAINEAANLLSVDQIAMQVKVKLIENLDSIIRESVKPMENIDGIKIINIEGMNGTGGGIQSADAGGNGGGGNLADQVVNSALRYRAQAPLLDSLLDEVGIKGGDINGLTAALSQMATPSTSKPQTPEKPAPKPAAKQIQSKPVKQKPVTQRPAPKPPTLPKNDGGNYTD
jgi:uncharacterized membrane protein YqiK